MGGKTIGKNGLHGRLEAAAGKPLGYTEDDKDAQVRRKAAGRGKNGEQENGEKIVILAAEHRGKPAANGEHDSIGHEIAGEHPSPFVERSGKAASNMRKGHVGDRGVQHFHEGTDDDYNGDNPRIESGSGRRKDGLKAGGGGGRAGGGSERLGLAVWRRHVGGLSLDWSVLLDDRLVILVALEL